MGKKSAPKKARQETTTAIAVQSPRHVAEQGSTEALIQQAITSGANVEVMERLFSLREKVKAEQAKEAFVQAMADFQTDVPTIKKTKKVMERDGSRVRYTFAPLDAIIEQIRDPLKKHGLSYRWETENKEGTIVAICTITHVLGHSETSKFEVPIDSNQYMSSPQRYASALTFAKRYSLVGALGIATGDEDTDATDVVKEKQPINQKSRIMFLLRELQEDTSTRENIEAAVKRITSLKLEESNYETIISRLENQVHENHESADIRG